jgi:hypothetical protein
MGTRDLKLGGEIMAQPTRDIRFPARRSSVYISAAPAPWSTQRAVVSATSYLYTQAKSDTRQEHQPRLPHSRHINDT